MRRQAAGLAGRAMSAFAPRYSSGVVNFSTASTGGWRGASAMYRSGAPSQWTPGSTAAIRTFPARAFSAVPPAHPAPTPNSKMQDEFISGTSAAYLESLEDYEAALRLEPKNKDARAEIERMKNILGEATPIPDFD